MVPQLNSAKESVKLFLIMSPKLIEPLLLFMAKVLSLVQIFSLAAEDIF